MHSTRNRHDRPPLHRGRPPARGGSVTHQSFRQPPMACLRQQICRNGEGEGTLIINQPTASFTCPSTPPRKSTYTSHSTTLPLESSADHPICRPNREPPRKSVSFACCPSWRGSRRGRCHMERSKHNISRTTTSRPPASGAAVISAISATMTASCSFSRIIRYHHVDSAPG